MVLDVWFIFSRPCFQDGRIDYNEFVAMMQKGNAGLGKKGENNFGLRMHWSLVEVIGFFSFLFLLSF